MKRINLVYLSKRGAPIHVMTDRANIPSKASTHYSYRMDPEVLVAKTTCDGVAHKPKIQRRNSGGMRPVAQHIDADIIDIPRMSDDKKITQKKFRKNINKEALAEYFDNAVLPTRAKIAQENLDTWLMQTAIELENADIENAKQNVTEEEIRKFVERQKTVVTYCFQDENTTDNKGVEEDTVEENTYNNPWAEIAAYAHDLDGKEYFGRRFFAEEVNASVTYRFINKHSGADTAAAMRALDKQNAHNTKLARFLHQMQITK